MCVDKCPTGIATTGSPKLGAATGCTNTESVPDCKNANAHNTYQVLKYCLPDVTEMNEETAKKWNNAWNLFLDTASGSNVQDVITASKSVWISCLMAPIYAFIFIAIMSAIAEYIAWFCVFIV